MNYIEKIICAAITAISTGGIVAAAVALVEKLKTVTTPSAEFAEFATEVGNLLIDFS